MITEMKKMKQLGKSSATKVITFYCLGVLAGLLLLMALGRLLWHSKYYPGVAVAGIEIEGLTREQAKQKIVDETANYKMTLTFNGSSWITESEVVKFEVDESLNEAYRVGRRLKVADYLLFLVNEPNNFELRIAEGSSERLNSLISEIASTIEIPAKEVTINLGSKSAVVTNGEDGVRVDVAELVSRVNRSARTLDNKEIPIPTQIVEKALSISELSTLDSRANKLRTKNLILKLDYKQIRLSGGELVAMLMTETQNQNIVDQEKVTHFVEGVADSLNSPAEDARFEFVDGKVKEFAPGKDGIEVSVQPTTVDTQKVIEKLLAEDIKVETVEIVATRTPPSVTMDKVNELGIKERIGRGESYYAHSIANRIYNVGLAASRTNSALIPPGGEYSFNKTVGEISGATGYKTAYVISGGRTVLGDGGGVCQVSTTLFRAAMNAGLPITERWAHAYRVGYYEQNSKPGIDATVYSPSKDLRFANDTPGHILVQTINDPKELHLVVEIYGTSDGRVATVSEPVVSGVSAPLPDIYQDDPSLPTGTTKQVDWSAWGAKASFNYKVVRGGETLQEKTFVSAYRPWANVYLRGTGSPTAQ